MHFFHQKTFYHSPGLITLDLSQNLLTSIPHRSFLVQRKMEVLRLNGNQLTELREGQFTSLNKLLDLDLSNNKIATIGNDTFKELIALVTLDLHENALHSLMARTFNGLINVLGLNLKGNAISSIHSCAFANMNMIRWLHLNNNRIVYIHADLFRDLRNLFRLDLRNNRITSINNRTLMLPRLNEIFLYGNRIECSCEFIAFLRSTWIKWIVVDCLSAKTLANDVIINRSVHAFDVDGQRVAEWDEFKGWACPGDCGRRSYIRTASCIQCSDNTNHVCVERLPQGNQSCTFINFKNIRSSRISEGENMCSNVSCSSPIPCSESEHSSITHHEEAAVQCQGIHPQRDDVEIEDKGKDSSTSLVVGVPFVSAVFLVAMCALIRVCRKTTNGTPTVHLSHVANEGIEQSTVE